MKDFNDFIKYCKTLDIENIEDTIMSDLDIHAKTNKISSDNVFWYQKSFNFKLMIKFLEEYHNWLNRD